MTGDTHPRLYFDATRRAELRGLRDHGAQALIWRNLLADAERYAALEPAVDWIAPVADDPCYENLYDRFCAMLSDAAIVEQLAFATAYGAPAAIADAARTRLLAAARRWRSEGELTPDYGTAYTTTRGLKAIAIGYDLLSELLDASEQDLVRTTLTHGARRLAGEWFSRPDVAGPVGVAPGRHSPHHSSVEWSSFGVVALCLLGEVDAAADWVAMAQRQFAEHLLDEALSPDGGQVEGTAFWASTVLSQLQFLDPLRRVTGVDLVARVARGFDLRLALAAYRPHRPVTGDGEPWYGESTGMSAILFAAAAETGDSALQRLAGDEPSTGRIETWPARTPRMGEQLRFAPGGYAYAWCRADLAAGSPPRARPAHFPSVNETYLRTGWAVDDLLVVIRAGRVSVYVGNTLIYEDITPVRLVDLDASRAAGTGIYRYDPPGLDVDASVLAIDGAVQFAHDGDRRLHVELVADKRVVRIRRRDGVRRSWAFTADSDAVIVVRRGRVVGGTPDGHVPDLSVGYGLLQLVPTDPRSFATTTAEPDEGLLEVEIRLAPGQP